jgi:rhodanese-related sulfurtransferase
MRINRFVMDAGPGTKGYVMRRILYLLLISGLLLVGCGEREPDSAADVVKTENGQYTNISVPALQDMLAEKDFVFVNVHIPFEGNIPDTDLSIPFDQIDQHLDQLPADQNAKIVLYCRSDRMSHDAARTLANLGYTNLYNLSGGFDAWSAAGLPLEME